MKDTSGTQVLGRTSLKRLGIVMVPTLIAAGALTVMMAEGAVAMSFDISGQTAQLKVNQLVGTNFAQYGGVDNMANGNKTPVAVSAFKTAKITGLCQSVATNLGPLGTWTLTLSATSADATDLIIDMQSLNASEADFTNINIGADASQMNSAAGAEGTAGAFAQEADGATLTNVEQVANATSAGSFDLHGMSLSIANSSTGCF